MNHLINAYALAQLLDQNTVVLDCRFSLADTELGRQQYQQGHIPGAVYMHLDDDLSGRKGKYGGRHPLPELSEITAKLQAAGINNNSRVVVYDDARFAFASRAWWLLRYLGLTDVKVLNGGFEAWKQLGYPISTESPPPQPGHFTPEPHLDWVKSHDDVQAIIETGSATLIDSREAPRYQGLEEPLDPYAGHIPSAINHPWQQTTDERGFALDEEHHQQRWADLPAGERVFYCGSGVTACVNLLSMAIAGDESAKLYVGSWSDWCAHHPKKS